MFTNMLSLPVLLAAFGIITLLYCLWTVVYRLVFHPLRRFPGPKLAAATTLYRAYYQIIQDGGQLRQWNKLHELYGDVVRIAPNQLHFSNPNVFDEMTCFASPFTKDDEFWYFTGQSDAMLGTSDETRHKQLFQPVANLFGPKGVKACEGKTWRNTMRLCDLLSGSAGQPVNMALGLRALMLDNVLEFVFGDSPTSLRGLVDLSFSSTYLLTTYEWMDWTGTWPRRNFPRLFPLVVSLLPNRLHRALLPGDHVMSKFFELTRESISNRLAVPKWTTDCFLSRFSSNCSLEYLTLECTAVILGGIVDSSNILQYGLFRICSDKKLQEDLYNELQSISSTINDPLSDPSALQRLPLLTGVIMESIRLTHGIVAGPPRTAPRGGAMLGGFQIPAGVSVTTSSIYPHLNVAVFPNPEAFTPARWQYATPEMCKSISAFSKGRRQCPARQLAMSQLYITFAALIHNFSFEAHQTSLQDFQLKAYLSGHFFGRQFHAKLQPRDNSRDT